MVTKKILICFMLALMVIRVIYLGYVVDNHGQDKESEKHNAFTHGSITIIIGWIILELNN